MDKNEGKSTSLPLHKKHFSLGKNRLTKKLLKLEKMELALGTIEC